MTAIEKLIAMMNTCVVMGESGLSSSRGAVSESVFSPVRDFVQTVDFV